LSPTTFEVVIFTKPPALLVVSDLIGCAVLAMLKGYGKGAYLPNNLDYDVLSQSNCQCREFAQNT
jgi:hypothetical protein